MLGSFSESFLAGDPRAEPFLAGDYRRPEARREHVLRARQRSAHPELIASLRSQESKLPTSAARLANLDALAKAGTVAVVTGQQVALFLGPLYAVYKAATAIVAARRLEEETGTRCVPVFWLQTEDHDLEEIDHCHVLDPEAQLVKLKLSTGGGPHRTSVKHTLLGPSVSAQLEALKSCLVKSPFGAEVTTLFEQHYRPGTTLADAFAGAMAAVFADEGLLLVDPRDPALAKVAATVHRTALIDAAAISNRLEAREHALESAGFEVQVKVRAGAPLSFFHPAGAQGPRYRLTPEGDGFTFVGAAGRVARDTLLEALGSRPECFSTSALLRPMLQDTLLPTVAYAGGPGELNYFAQLAPLYEAFGLPMPMVLPRARFRVLEPRTRSLLEKLEVSASDVETSREKLIEKVRPALPPGQPTPDALEQALVAAIEPPLNSLPATHDQDIEDGLKRTRATVARAAARFAGRYRRALLNVDSVLSDRVDRVQRALFPHGEPQERVLGLPPFAARVGVKAFKNLVLAHIDPWNPAPKDLAL